MEGHPISIRSDRYHVRQQGEIYYVVDSFMWCGVGYQRNAHLVCAYESRERASVRANEFNRGPRPHVRYYLVSLTANQAKTLVRELLPGWLRQYFDEEKLEWWEDSRIGMGLGWNELDPLPRPPRPVAWEVAMRRLEESGGKPDDVDLAA